MIKFLLKNKQTNEIIGEADSKSSFNNVNIGFETIIESIDDPIILNINGKKYKNTEVPLTEYKNYIIGIIDKITNSLIISGFDYNINNETLHFSYQSDDQQNFSDTFNAIAMKLMMGVQDIPETVDWNGWRNHTNEYKGELVVLPLNPELFIELYMKGALQHKSVCLELGKYRKQLIETAQTIEEINTLLLSWGI